MGRTLEALRALESRRQQPAVVAPVPRESLPELPVAPAVPAHHKNVETPPIAQVTPARPIAPEKCALPTTSEVAPCYLELAGRVSEQLSANYCNVVLLTSLDHTVEPCFSMTRLAQAFALQCPGNVLLVDGDLRCGRLSQSVSPTGPGIVEVMLGIASWPQVIHPTAASCIDFVACGHSQVPTFERPEFGWAALRPKYRVVLIGIAPADEPETHWLAARCDGVYLVLSRPHTKRHAASVAVNELRACGANLLGCVLAND